MISDNDEIKASNRKVTRISLSIWKLKTLLNNVCQSSKGKLEYFEQKENRNTTYKNLLNKFPSKQLMECLEENL